MAFIKGILQRCISAGGGVLGGASEYPQFLLLGLDKSEKSKLFYALKNVSPPTSKEEEVKYNYEDINSLFNHGLWDLPGSEAMREIWSHFYNAIKIHGVIFVVKEEDEIDESKRLLHALMNEDELRKSWFCVIINKTEPKKDDKDRNQAASKEKEKEKDELYYRLGLHRLHPSCMWRTKEFVLDLNQDKNTIKSRWEKTVLPHAQQVLEDTSGHNLKL